MSVRSLSFVLAAAVVLLVLSAAAPFLVSGEWSVRAQVGDAFGAAAAMASALALVGVALALRLQVREQSLSRAATRADALLRLVGALEERSDTTADQETKRRIEKRLTQLRQQLEEELAKLAGA